MIIDIQLEEETQVELCLYTRERTERARQKPSLGVTEHSKGKHSAEGIGTKQVSPKKNLNKIFSESAQGKH